MVTIEGDNLLCVTIINKGQMLEVKHSRDDEEMYNFKIIAALEKDQAPFDFDPHLLNCECHS